jgi:voltage-gated sodium channel
MLERLLKNPRTERVILTLIIVNAITLGLETSPSAMATFGPVLIAIDRIILSIFVLELAARLGVHRLSFFRDPWSVFDLAVVGMPWCRPQERCRCSGPCGCCGCCV